MSDSLNQDQLKNVVSETVFKQPVTDLHTHVFSPAFGSSPDHKGLMLWGIDDLLTYHYLIAEVFRVCTPDELPLDDFWAMSKQAQADHIWQHLFVNRTPISEACRGVVTTLHKLGLDPNAKDLAGYRKWFSEQDPDDFVNKVMEIGNVDAITMTNELFDPHEYQMWLDKPDALKNDPRFPTVLRIDRLLLDWEGAAKYLSERGYALSPELNDNDIESAKSCLRDWIKRMHPAYIAVSLPSQFHYTSPEAGSGSDKILNKIIMPVCEEAGLPFAMMIGVTRRTNPLLKMAGDMCGKSDIESVTRLLAAYPNNKFMITMLARENQHELAVAARKFPNLMVFGCWWFLNNPSLITEITRMRMELLGTSFIPQHSDARILDQLLYKWQHTRELLIPILTDKYGDLMNSGVQINQDMIQRDVKLLLRDNIRQFWAHD